MVEVLAVAERILNAVLQALSLLGIIQGQTQHAAVESTPFAIETIASNATNAIDNPTYGLAAIAARLDALTSDGEYSLANVLAVTGTPQQANDPVTLPTNPPAAYGGATADESAQAVWEYNIPFYNVSTGAMVTSAGRVASNFAFTSGYPIASAPGFVVYAQNPEEFYDVLPAYFTPDFSTVVPGDTVLSWLNRELGPQTWQVDTDFYGYFPYARFNPTFPFPYDIVCKLTDADLHAIAGTAQTASGAPVWPGLANVTLLDPVTIDPPGGVISTPCDGVIVEITGHPSWAGKYSFGTVTSWRNCGAIAFTSDNGDEEAPQTLGMTPCVYCPKTMQTASGLVYRTAIGYAGTITPWKLLSSG